MRIVLLACVLLLWASPASALQCPGGADFLESMLGEWCVHSEWEVLEPDAMAALERMALDRRSSPRTRAVAAHVAAEQHLRAGRWSSAERLFSLALGLRPVDAHTLEAGRSVARLRRGARVRAARDAENVIANVCDRCRIARDASFDELSACRRAILVATELAPTGAARTALRDRWSRFNAQWPLHDEDDDREYALAECVVHGAAPCLPPPAMREAQHALHDVWDHCLEVSTDPATCSCAELASRPRAAIAIDEGGFRSLAALREGRYVDFVLLLDARGQALSCTFQNEAR